MSAKSYSLNSNDIVVISKALISLPELGLENSLAQAVINKQCCDSAIEKLLSHQPKFSLNEVRVISASLDAMYYISSGEIKIDDPVINEFASQNLFTINKLRNVFHIDID